MPAAASARPFDPAQIDELAILVAASTVVSIIAYRIRFPGGLLFGAMLTSAALHGSGYIHVAMPWWVTNTVMIAFGAVTGSRFAGTPLRLLADFIGAAFGSFAVAVTVTAIFAAGLVGILGLPIGEVMIAYAPGAVDAMMLLALALNLDPVYVGAHHLVRIFFVSLAMPLLARRAGPARKKADVPTTAQAAAVRGLVLLSFPRLWGRVTSEASRVGVACRNTESKPTPVRFAHRPSSVRGGMGFAEMAVS